MSTAGRVNAFRDRIALVTGGARGIGRALGTALAGHHATVVLTDHDEDGLREAQATLAAASPKAAERIHLRLLDVTDPAAFQAVVAEVTRRWKRIDFLFNNAGVALLGEAQDMTDEAWKRVIDVNFNGVVHGVQAAYPHMVQQGQGHICNVACVAGLGPVPLATAYSATKHAVVGLSTSLRAEAADHGVTVSVVCPGAVATDLFRHSETAGLDPQALHQAMPSERWLISPQRCAEQILRGVARRRAIITVPTHARFTWWFYRLMPGAALALGRRFARVARSRLGSGS